MVRPLPKIPTRDLLDRLALTKTCDEGDKTPITNKANLAAQDFEQSTMLVGSARKLA